ncbi:MAG: amino acid adenylation domain-containing protein, partial [Gemmatimonadota bacterium]
MGHRVDACEVDTVVGSGGPTTLHDVLVCPGYDHAVRWRPGERLEQLFEDRCDWMRETGRGGHLAVDSAAVALTYDQLDARANQLARHLLTGGARAGDRIAVLFDEPVHAYVAMLAVLKINAAYVPLDVGFPADRLSYITRDAGVRLVLSLSHLRGHLETVDAAVLCLDEATAPVGAQPRHRLSAAEKGDPADDLCYVIYTSGSTGRPKGVPIEHASICNFVRVAVEVYGIEWHDRVYQGMTLAFDFAVEETWVPLVVGATLVPKPGGSSLLGPELREFLHAHRVSALCCVPTLLATVDEDLPGLRFLLVSGEACPQDLIARWHKPGRRFLNVYGPTEATVTATCTPVHPDKPVTIGVPLPTYSVVILDPDQSRALPRGQTGEIGIAGVGLATGYLNRADLTERAFIHDFLDIPGNPSGRIYRTGDLGRVNENGEIEYHGRIDTQVKIRGYRIELTEIESVLLQVPGIAQAVVDTHCPEPGIVDLVGYYSLRPDTTRPDPEHVYQHLRARLPGYMVPAYLEPLTAIPTMPSGKANRKNLPAPRGTRSLASHHAYTPPTTPTEATLAELLAAALRLDRVSVDSHFFDDLGANSLLIARFCARVRQHGGLPSVATKDVYLHPTIRSLAAALDAALVAAPPASVAPAALAAPPLPTRACTAQYVLCGALQLACFLAYTCLTAVLVVEGFQWIFAASGVVDVYQRSVVFGAATFVGLSAIPILAKWLLVGRWKPQEIPIWSLGYLRFWLVRTLTRFSPLSLFVGSPLYVLYLRALGAKIGRGVLILSRNPPVCTDLLTIGDGTVIRKDAFFTCYRASAGRIQTGRVTLGKDVVVGEATVIEIHTEMGDRAQIGHSSALHAGLTVPAGERWHGSPAQRTNVDYRRVEPAQCGDVRKFFYSSLQLLNRLVLVAPLAIAVVITPLRDVPQLAALLGSGAPAFRHWWFYRDAFVASAILFFGGLLFGLMFVVTVPRVLNLALRPGRVYPLYGFHYWIQRSIARITNAKSLMYLFGDSSFIVYYLRALGYDLSRVQQTGSNFGVEQKHEIPYLTSVGTGTIVS